MLKWLMSRLPTSSGVGTGENGAGSSRSSPAEPMPIGEWYMSPAFSSTVSCESRSSTRSSSGRRGSSYGSSRPLRLRSRNSIRRRDPIGGRAWQDEGMSQLVPKQELEAAIEARKEVGSELEPAVIDAFVERIEQRLVERSEESERALKRKRDHQKEMVLGAMGISVPLLAIAAIFTGLAGVIVVCAALAVIAIVSSR